MQDNIGHFGPGVIGEEEYEREQELLQQATGPGSKFGTAVTQHPEGEPEGPPSDASDELQEDELPDGYELQMRGPNYYEVTRPDGSQVEGPTPKGLFEGKTRSIQAAWEDQLNEELERKEEAEREAAQGSIEEIKDRLKDNPDAVDSVMNKELQRADGPREEVFRAVYHAETELRDGEPRPEVLEVLADFIDIE